MCNSSSSVLNRTSPSLLHTFVVDTLLNFLLPFNIILTYTNTSHLTAFRRLLVHIGMCLVLSPFLSELAGKDILVWNRVGFSRKLRKCTNVFIQGNPTSIFGKYLFGRRFQI